MKMLVIGLLAMVAAPVMGEPVKVKSHVRKDGTYVAPHVRTAPDGKASNNWGSKPNVNPYTGKSGTADPYKPKPLPKPRGF